MKEWFFRPIVSLIGLLLRPIAQPRFARKEWPSQFLKHGGSERSMNASDEFAAIVDEHYEGLFRFALSLTRAESDACDLTQQTFCTWATKGHQLRDRSKVKTWLFTTLHRAFLAARRRQNRFPHYELEEVAEELPAAAAESADRADSAQVLSALAGVDEVYQAAVALFYLEDCSYKEIAAVIGVPIGTVKSRIARGLAQLREILLSDGFGDSTVNHGGISSGMNPDEPAPAPEIPVSVASRRARLAAGTPGRNCDEWDFSATGLRELPGQG